MEGIQQISKMEGIAARIYRRVKCYRRRRRYEKLGHREIGPNQRTRFWLMRMAPKLKLRLKRKLRIRDWFVNMIMRISNTLVVAGSGEGVAKFGMSSPVKEYDEKVIMKMYQTLIGNTASSAGADRCSIDRCSTVNLPAIDETLGV